MDLSLTATGAWWGNPYDPAAPHCRDEIATPARKKGESDIDWNARRFHLFRAHLLEILALANPQLAVVEVTTHAHVALTRARGTGYDRRTLSSRGIEFRAGLGLGRATGWLDGVLAGATMRFPRFETIEAKDVKLRVAGSQAASKGAVAAKLAEVWGWTTSGWRESEIDALACAVAWVRTVEMDERERMYRALAAEQDAARKPRRSHPRTTQKQRIG